MRVNAEHAMDVMRTADCLYDQFAVDQVLDRLGARITADLANLNPILLCVMNGGLVPMGQLLSRLNFPLRLDYLHATRYREQTRGSDLHWYRYPTQSLEGQHLLLIDDIRDEGYTLEAIQAELHSVDAASVRTAVLAEKNHDRGVRPALDYVGLQVPDRYVFGYGMDYKGYWRNAMGIYAIAE